MKFDGTNASTGVSRRTFARLVALGGSAALMEGSSPAWPRPPSLPPTPSSPDESFWLSVRAQFVMPPNLAVMNAANLCPSPASVLENLYTNSRDIDRDPSFNNREKMLAGKETTRKIIADFLRVTPEEIVITRNTSEANNLVSSGIELKAGDEVIVVSDNHPSNNQAWKEKAKRFGFAVRVVEQVTPHPGPEYYIEAVTRQITPRTKVLAFTHLTNTGGDLFPAKELCRLARERGILSHIDGAQSFGLLDVDLGDIQPDFYAGSAHKWPCGPKETGVLFVNRKAQSSIWPSVISASPGATGISKTFEAFGQRDDAAIIAFGEALKFHAKIGRDVIENRSRQLAQALIRGVQKIDGIKLWTHPDPARSLAVVTFLPGSLDVKKLSLALYEKDRIAGAPRLGPDRPGVRFSPHYYNTMAEIERLLAAIKRYMSQGI